MSNFVTIGLVNKKTIGFSSNDTQLANQLAAQAFTMNCNEVHVNTPHRIGDSVLIVGAGSKCPIKVHFHGVSITPPVNQSTVTFVMAPTINSNVGFSPRGNTFSSYGLNFKN